MSLMVLACSLCANTQLHQRWWELGAVAPASLVLLVEGLLSNSTLKSLPSPLRIALHGLIGLALVAGVWGSLTAPILGGVGFITLLALRSGLVVALTVRRRPRAVLSRLVVTLVALGGCLLMQAPVNRPPDELVSLLTATPFHFDEQSWALSQLKAQGPDGLAAVERRLDDLREGDPRRGVLVTLELQQHLGGSPARRAVACARFAASGERDEQLNPRIAHACGER
jgi:hypothetical protein